MAGLINIISMIIGSVGIFFGFYYLGRAPGISLDIVTGTTVGMVGLLAFVRHVFFHRSDAQRLGWETDRPDWMFEVGFANLAFGCCGLVAVFARLGMKAEGLILSGYALYLFQAAMLHGYRYFTSAERSAARLWRSFLATILYAGMMTFFALHALFN